MSHPIGTSVLFHTTRGDVTAIVVGHDPESNNTDDDHELYLFPGREQRHPDVGLSGPDYRASHEDVQAGGFSVGTEPQGFNPAEQVEEPLPPENDPSVPPEQVEPPPLEDDPSVPAEPVSDGGADRPA